ncbi:hypothetical protein GCM10010172_67120 [Paractinoplanes ferrugineus]|uniref:Uncharacterized protein n=1 Tax=Paractinoplanes ferrugineus TaxID=113564 RepID=A0A919MMD0_9ACTN|nr:hypothetical protein Afe05nite_49670 [Actinoplanes ferrugineus]
MIVIGFALFSLQMSNGEAGIAYREFMGSSTGLLLGATFLVSSILAYSLAGPGRGGTVLGDET